jgi:hypothetical protein
MRTKGVKERPSERKRAASRANARKPRGRWAGTPEREVLEAAKAELRAALPDAAGRLVDILRDPSTPPELFLQAFRFAADRAGLPALSQLSGPPTDYCGVKLIEFVGYAPPPGWDGDDAPPPVAGPDPDPIAVEA